jgi:ribonuclease T
MCINILPFNTRQVSEKQALNKIFQTVSAEVKAQECTRAILVGHNAFFDLGFLVAASNRAKLKSPFQSFNKNAYSML